MSQDISAILKLQVPLIVRIGDLQMTMAEVLGMIPGTIIEIPKSADDELDLLINNKCIGSGTAVKVGENFGVRISFVGDLNNRIKALGSSDEEDDDDELAALAEAMLSGQM